MLLGLAAWPAAVPGRPDGLALLDLQLYKALDIRLTQVGGLPPLTVLCGNVFHHHLHNGVYVHHDVVAHLCNT